MFNVRGAACFGFFCLQQTGGLLCRDVDRARWSILPADAGSRQTLQPAQFLRAPASLRFKV
jgi:hypothetical protein